MITPINKNAIVISRILSGIANSLIAASLLLIIGTLFGVTVAMGIIGVFYIMLVTAILGAGFTCIAISLSTYVKRVDAFAIFSQAVGMPLWFISGGITPVSALPSWLAIFSTFDPLTYVADISRAVIMQGFITTGQLITDFSVLLVFLVLMILLAFKTFRSTIE